MRVTKAVHYAFVCMYMHVFLRASVRCRCVCVATVTCGSSWWCPLRCHPAAAAASAWPPCLYLFLLELCHLRENTAFTQSLIEPSNDRSTKARTHTHTHAHTHTHTHMHAHTHAHTHLPQRGNLLSATFTPMDRIQAQHWHTLHTSDSPQTDTHRIGLG